MNRNATILLVVVIIVAAIGLYITNDDRNLPNNENPAAMTNTNNGIDTRSPNPNNDIPPSGNANGTNAGTDQPAP